MYVRVESKRPQVPTYTYLYVRTYVCMYIIMYILYCILFHQSTPLRFASVLTQLSICIHSTYSVTRVLEAIFMYAYPFVCTYVHLCPRAQVISSFEKLKHDRCAISDRARIRGHDNRRGAAQYLSNYRALFQVHKYA